MALDTANALYVGRPCYFEPHEDQACDPSLWTDRRYSEAVVDSTAVVISRWLQRQPAQTLVLVGYSGGGTLAALVTGHLTQRVDLLVTVASNLDTERWSSHHGYRPLAGSLNPMTAARLSGVRQLHLAGSEDSNVPVDIISAFARAHHGKLKVLPGYDHSCCWLELWEKNSQTLMESAAAIGEG
jgi:dienelactone hydrolase